MDRLEHSVHSVNRQSFVNQSDHVVTEGFARALEEFGAVPLITLLVSISDLNMKQAAANGSQQTEG